MYAIWIKNKSGKAEMLAHYPRIADAIAFRDSVEGQAWVERL